MPDARGIIKDRLVPQQDIHEATKLFSAVQRRGLAADICRNDVLRMELWILSLKRIVRSGFDFRYLASVSSALAGCHRDAANECSVSCFRTACVATVERTACSWTSSRGRFLTRTHHFVDHLYVDRCARRLNLLSWTFLCHAQLLQANRGWLREVFAW